MMAAGWTKELLASQLMLNVLQLLLFCLPHPPPQVSSAHPMLR